MKIKKDKYFYSAYFDKSFEESFVRNAFKLYKKWCKDNDVFPECSLDELLAEDGRMLLDHVLYHAEIVEPKLFKS